MSDFTELKGKHRIMWALGEYDRIAEGLTISTDQTLRVAKIRPGERILDVATGTGITALAARERSANVTAVDLTPELLAVARTKAAKEGWNDIDFREGDAEALPFEDASFDVVLSTCGPMFAPDQFQVAAELARVTKPGDGSSSSPGHPKVDWEAGFALLTNIFHRRRVWRAPSIGATRTRCGNS